tara:strand:+ start:5855 stop:6091 length:237 start_codon:yes stop_codon:yes gene_type:complete
MNLFKIINVRLFLISLFLGLFAVYITMPDLRIIKVYPTPENAQILQYQDKADNCFSIKEKEVPCPKNKEGISKIPIQS